VDTTPAGDSEHGGRRLTAAERALRVERSALLRRCKLLERRLGSVPMVAVSDLSNLGQEAAKQTTHRDALKLRVRKLEADIAVAKSEMNNRTQQMADDLGRMHAELEHVRDRLAISQAKPVPNALRRVKEALAYSRRRRQLSAELEAARQRLQALDERLGAAHGQA
jgi:chromosome segregation ATPase